MHDLPYESAECAEATRHTISNFERKFGFYAFFGGEMTGVVASLDYSLVSDITSGRMAGNEGSTFKLLV